MLSLLFLPLTFSAFLYEDPNISIDARVADLLAKMTLEEKVGQICLFPGQFTILPQVTVQNSGAVLGVFGADALPIYDYALTTRLKIPLLFGIDAIHGNGFWPGATIYPTQLTQASSWNPDLIERIGAATGEELQFTGLHWIYSPVLCIARDPRWGRVDETYGEDPYLIGEFGSHFQKGLQSKNIWSCPKHYAGYSDTQGGRDSSESDQSIRKLRSWYLPPFQKVVQSGAMSIMSSYQATDGVPACINKFLLQTTLRDEWKFPGFVVTDWDSIGDLINRQEIFENYSQAAAATIEAGVDLIMSSLQFYDAAIEALNHKLLSETALNRAVSRVLRAKFQLGLFEDPRRPQLNKVQVGTPEHRNLALQAAQESLILLKNNKTLPVSPQTIKTIAVLGPNADNADRQLGDWVLGTGQAFPLSNPFAKQPRENTTTVLDGIKATFPNAKIIYEPGAKIDSSDKADLDAAISAAKQADLIIVVIGDSFSFVGETKSTATNELQGTQKELLNALVSVGKPFVIDLIASKPLIIPEAIVQAAGAIICQFNPGNLGGKAFAQAIAGEINPSGKLTIGIPKHIGQIPVFYNIIRGTHGQSYADLSFEPRWAFGHGLSYSTFSYSNAVIDKNIYGKNEEITLTVQVANLGPYDGAEIVQVYIYDKVTSATWAVQELKAFQKVFIKSGQSQKVTIKIKVSDLSIVNATGQRVVEPGDFELRVAQASDNIRIKLQFKVQ